MNRTTLHGALLVATGLAVLGGIAYSSGWTHTGPTSADAQAVRSSSRATNSSAPPIAAPVTDPTFGIPQGQPVAPHPPDLRPQATPDEAAAVLAVLAKDPVLDEIGVPDARQDAVKARIYELGDDLYDAYFPLTQEQDFDSVVPAYVGSAFGVDPPEVYQARLVATGATALHAWVDTSQGQIVQIDTNGLPVSYDWVGKSPPKEPSD